MRGNTASGTDLLSLVTSDSCDGQVQVVYQEKVLYGEGGQALEQALQGSGHIPKLLEIKKHLFNALRQRVWTLGGSVGRQELSLVILKHSFQARTFCDSVIP